MKRRRAFKETFQFMLAALCLIADHASAHTFRIDVLGQVSSLLLG